MEEYQGALCESGLSRLATGSASKGPADVTINEPADWVRKSRRVKPGNFALLRLMFIAPESLNETTDKHRAASRNPKKISGCLRSSENAQKSFPKNQGFSG